MPEIVLIRHAQSANNAGPDHARKPDPALTELGEKQAELTGQWLRSVGIDQLYCSPFLRSLLTAQAIAEHHTAPVFIRPDLCEQGGCYSGHEGTTKRGAPGMNREQIKQRFPNWGMHESIDERGWWHGDYETLPEAEERTRTVIDWIASRHGNQEGRIVFVIHADFKRRILEAILPIRREHMPSSGLEVGPLSNTSVTRLSLVPGSDSTPQWVVQSLNSTSHLPESLWTT